ncbi:hypothetical protein LA080_011996 [Diaporthe eres]|nr:hypothetical protein LA080_011996 [Diaporthe eres]
MENFLSPFVEDPVPTTPPDPDVHLPQRQGRRWTIEGRRKWTYRGFDTLVLSETQSSQFGTSPLQCHVCFRTSLLPKMAGMKRLELSVADRARYIYAKFEDEAKSWKITFYLTLVDCFFCVEDSAWSIPAKQRSEDVLSKESLDRINQDCIQPCRDNHPQCKRIRPRSHEVFPSRIVEVSMVGSYEQPRLFARLADVQSLPVDVRYLTLSHAWGIEPKLLTLGRENLDQFQQSIPQVGIQLHLDRLFVIIQQKPALDWATECPRMGLMYSSSDLNLSASGFADARSGMLGPPRRPIVPPTYSREWVIQENMLSPRSLHFTAAGELLWERYSLIASEVWPERIVQSLMSSDQWRQRKKVFADLTCAHPQNGLSKTEREEVHHTVLPQAGSLGLIESLGWVPHPELECTNATPAAPSWSMAPVNGGSYHSGGFYGDFSPLASLLEASSISANDASATIPGITSQCRLRIKGFAHRLGVDPNESICGHTCYGVYLNLGTLWLPCLWGSREPFPDRVEQHCHGAYPSWDSAPLYRIVLNESKEYGKNRISGIIAKQVSEESDGPVLERVEHWFYHVHREQLKAGGVDVEVLQQYEKQRIFYLV